MDNLLSRYITISLLFGNIQKQTVCSGDDFSGKLYLIYMQNITTQTNKQKVSHVWTLLVFSSWNRTWILLVIDVVTQGVDINNNVAKPSNINDQSPPLEEDFLLRWPWVLGIGGGTFHSRRGGYWGEAGREAGWKVYSHVPATRVSSQ